MPDDFSQPFRTFGQIINLSGKVSGRLPNALEANLPVTNLTLKRAEQGLETYENFYFNNSLMRQISVPVFKGGGLLTGELVQVAAPLDATIETLQRLQTVLWIAFPAGLGLSFIFGYLFTGRSLRPVRTITQAAAKLSSDDLNTRLPVPPAADELQDLVTTFNGMLDRLGDAFNRLRRFTGDVSHELRTPLSVLRAEAELALRRDRDATYYQNSLKVIQTEAENMSSVVDALLLLAKAQSKAMVVNWQELEPMSYLQNIMDACRHQIDEKQIQVEIKVSVPGKVYASLDYLAIAIKNLLLNAIKHSHKAGKIEIFAWRDHKGLHISLRDFGEGIPKDSLAYIFDTFYRADTVRNRAMGGIGIGLSLAKAMANLHGGNIAAESWEGAGAYFVMTIPQKHGPKTPSQNEESAAQVDRNFLTNAALTGRSTPENPPENPNFRS
jgi:heavy metal sensor kinase